VVVSIELLADHPEHVETLARWHCEEDGRAGDPEWLAFWRGHLRCECGRERIPLAFVALDGNDLVGHVSLVERNMSTHRELSPWLAGTLVHPSRRGSGLGTELVRHAVERAAELGIRRLYLYTERARPFYEKLGWGRLWDEVYEGECVAVMAIELTSGITLRPPDEVVEGEIRHGSASSCTRRRCARTDGAIADAEIGTASGTAVSHLDEAAERVR
jgi:predicted N-acetyltransferase YhbS